MLISPLADISRVCSVRTYLLYRLAENVWRKDESQITITIEIIAFNHECFD
jgi:hypothetical protein